jgi:hypothetical protein
LQRACLADASPPARNQAAAPLLSFVCPCPSDAPMAQP